MVPHAALSVVIPTHRRPQILEKCLQHLAAQTIARQLEVIVVHDGEDTGGVTGKVIDACNSSPHPFAAPIRSFSIPKSQQGIARNRGVALAIAPRILFLGDDILLAPDACAHHLTPPDDAVLGYTTWDPACGITPVMEWLETSGWQFGYPFIARYAHTAIPASIQHRFTYASNLSLPTAVAKAIPFRDDLRLYGWEDVLWGKALRTQGIRLFYEPDACGLHHHHLALANSLKRMETLGTSLMQIRRIDPTFCEGPHGWKMWMYRLRSLLPTMAGLHVRAILRGIRNDV